MHLRLDNQLAARLRDTAARYDMTACEIVRRAVRWGSARPDVANAAKCAVATTGGTVVEFRALDVGGLTGRQVRGILRAYLAANDRPRPEPFSTPLVEGVDYNVPDAEVIRRFAAKGAKTAAAGNGGDANGLA